MLLKTISVFNALYIKFIPENLEDEKSLLQLSEETELKNRLSISHHSVEKEKIISLLLKL